jgi:membrane protein DedA with SNARE-associated domain
MEPLLDWVTQYGYPAVFALQMLGIIGFPMPDETLLVTVGFLVSKGSMWLPLAILAAALGSACGITVSYSIGRFVGLPVIHKYGKFFHVSEANLTKMHNWFERWGKWTMVLAYYVPGVRHVAAIFAGTAKLPYHEFAIFAYTGALVWTSTFITLGYYLGPQVEKLAPLLHEYLVIIAIAVAVLIVLALVAHHFWIRRRAKAAAK